MNINVRNKIYMVTILIQCLCPSQKCDKGGGGGSKNWHFVSNIYFLNDPHALTFGVGAYFWGGRLLSGGAYFPDFTVCQQPTL